MRHYTIHVTILDTTYIYNTHHSSSDIGNPALPFLNSVMYALVLAGVLRLILVLCELKFSPILSEARI